MRIYPLALGTLCALATCGISFADTGDLERKVADILPGPCEQKWTKIPWRTDLLQARREAAAADKPLFLWLMDGDPLGFV